MITIILSYIIPTTIFVGNDVVNCKKIQQEKNIENLRKYMFFFKLTVIPAKTTAHVYNNMYPLIS